LVTLVRPLRKIERDCAVDKRPVLGAFDGEHPAERVETVSESE
jgi:hypothetical protein